MMMSCGLRARVKQLLMVESDWWNMNRPKITKQTLKELRGELLAKQNAVKQHSNTKKVEGTFQQYNKTEKHRE